MSTAEQSSELARKLQLVIQTGLLLTKSYDLEAIVQSATDAGLALCGAQFGAFFYNVIDATGESYALYTLSGVDREKFSKFPMPRNTRIFAPTFMGTEIVRSGDITKDPRYGHNAPYYGMPLGHLPVRSYLALPVKNAGGEILGGLFYGHEKDDIFQQDSEDLISTVASQAAVAIENARLRNQLTNEIGELQKHEKHHHGVTKRLGELAAIVASSDDAIMSKNLDGIITSWNQAATNILGYTSNEMIGQSVLKIIPDHLLDDEKLIISKIRAGERIEHFETIRLTKDGKLLEVSLTVSPIKDETGTIIGASKILRDISSKKRIELSLIQAEKIAATGRMAATIAHEINNPLEAVMNLMYLLRPSIKDMEGLTYLNAAEGELNRVSHIAKQTLGYYREHASAKRTSLSHLIEHAIAIYEPRCTSAGIRIERVLTSSQQIMMRTGEMMQVVSNLIANAIYAMPDGGILRIAVKDTHDAEDSVILTVEDNGVGIAADDLPKIFDAFFTTRSAVGTGIGLFISRQFVEGHGGQIHASSNVDTETHGTTIAVTLPGKTAYEYETA